MAVLYVDECGEEGFSDTSTEWLILGGALHPNQDGTVRNVIAAYDDFKSKHYAENWYFHFRNRRHDERLGFINAIRNTGVRALCVAIHKPSLRKPEKFKKKYYLYFYALRFLLEKATIWSRDHHQQQLRVILSTRKGLKLENLTEYLDRLTSSPFVNHDRMVWDYLRLDDIELAPNQEFRGLQIADCIASSLGKVLEASKYGTTEPRYLADLYPCFHLDKLEYGKAIKVWPSIPADQWRERLFPAYKMGRAANS